MVTFQSIPKVQDGRFVTLTLTSSAARGGSAAGADAVTGGSSVATAASETTPHLFPDFRMI